VGAGDAEAAGLERADLRASVPTFSAEMWDLRLVELSRILSAGDGAAIPLI
jgi:hypothetical protein